MYAYFEMSCVITLQLQISRDLNRLSLKDRHSKGYPCCVHEINVLLADYVTLKWYLRTVGGGEYCVAVNGNLTVPKQ